MVKSFVEIAAVAALLLQGSASACIDPLSPYYTGIVLNNGEAIHPERIEALAGSERSYIKACVKLAVETNGSGDAASDSVERCSYKLRCGFTDNAMLFIGYSADGLGLFGDVARVIVFFDTARVPTDGEKARALGAELRRLAGLGIVTISEVTIGNAAAAIELASGQYWSAQDTVLAFNQWFDGSGMNGVWGVKGVRGSGCGSGVTYDLPAARFEPVAGNINAPRMRTSIPRMSAEAGPAGIRVRVAPVGRDGAVLTITDMRGRELARQALRSGASEYFLTRSSFPGASGAAGLYAAAMIYGGRTMQTCLVVNAVK